jgi:autotransporter passenger strand-loop-strand repeat protein
MRQRNVSANTIASYRDTFRLLFLFAQARLRKPPSALSLGDLDAPFLTAFLNDLETKRGASAKTRNLRLTAIRSFFRFVSFEEPAHSALIQRVLAIPSKRHDKRLVPFLARPEIEAVLAAPDRTTWFGRRDHTLLLVAAQTGLRLSELIDLDRDAVAAGGSQTDHGVTIGTVVDSGTEPVSSGVTASNTVVSSGGSLLVLPHGLADPAMIYSGGSETVSSGGTDDGVHISGGPQFVSGFGQRRDDLCRVAGCRQRGHRDGMNGGTEVVSSGSTTSGTLLASGQETVLRGGRSSGTDILSGQIMWRR